MGDRFRRSSPFLIQREFETVHADVHHHLFFAGEKEPAIAIGPMFGGICGERLRHVPGRINRKRYHVNVCRQFIHELPHFLCHDRARAATVRKNEVCNPDLAFEIVKRNGLAALIGK